MRQAAGLLALGLATVSAIAGQAHAQQVQVSPANRTISITATENAERRADRAALHVGYRLYAADSQHVYADAARISNAIAAALEQAGVKKDDISSDGQSIQPTQPFESQNLSPDERAQRKFQAQQSWTVKTTPEAVARVLAAAVAAGANESGQVEWSVADDASLTAEAGTRALTHAREIATRMAKGLDATIGNLLYASNHVEVARPMPMMARANMSMADGAVEKAPQLSLNAPMITRSATVSAIFAIQ